MPILISLFIFFLLVGKTLGGDLCPVSRVESVDVAIIGAGITGLTAAYRIAKHSPNVSIAIIEGRPRVGGRLENQPLSLSSSNFDPIEEPFMVEGGGQWLGATQDRILSLVKELQLETYPTYTNGSLVYFSNDTGRIEVEDITLPPSVQEIRSKIDKISNDITLSNSSNGFGLGQIMSQLYDSLSYAEWVIQECATYNSNDSVLQTECTSSMFDIVLTAIGSPYEISLFYLMYFLKSVGGTSMVDAIGGGAQDRRVKGGAQLITLRMKDYLELHPAAEIYLNTRVKSIHKSDGTREVTIETNSDKEFRAKQVFVAMQPQLYQEFLEPSGSKNPIDYVSQNLQPKIPSGVKVHVVYSTPFWRKYGLSGMGFTDSGIQTFDNSPLRPQDDESGPGVILFFLSPGPDDSIDKLVEHAIHDLSNLFGDEASDYMEIVYKDWSHEEKFTKGCVSYWTPGTAVKGLENMLIMENSSCPSSSMYCDGQVHFGSADTSRVWTGYMDGGVRSGEKFASFIAEWAQNA